jgi:Bles03-like protein
MTSSSLPAHNVDRKTLKRPGSTSRGQAIYTKDYRDQQDLARVLAKLRAMGISRRLSYKEDAATRALRYGSGAALYVSQPGTLDFSKRRDAYMLDDQHELFGTPHENLERTVEEVFARPEPYGPFPA